MKKILVYLIKGYQLLISPLLGTRCRFHPSCSTYAIEAIELNGSFVGFLATIKRLSKCHPFNHGGIDYPVIESSRKMNDRPNRPTVSGFNVVQVGMQKIGNRK